jgi:hypothetical protein
MLWSEFLATDPEVPGSIPSVTSFADKLWAWNGVYCLVRIAENLLERESYGSGLESRDYRP